MRALIFSAASALELAAAVLTVAKAKHEEYTVVVHREPYLRSIEAVHLQVEPDGQDGLRLELFTASSSLSIVFTTPATVQTVFDILFGTPAFRGHDLSAPESAPIDETTERAWQPGDPCASCGSTATSWDPVEGARCGGCGRSDSDE